MSVVGLLSRALKWNLGELREIWDKCMNRNI